MKIFSDESERRALIMALADELELIARDSAISEVGSSEDRTGKTYDTALLRKKIRAWAEHYAKGLLKNLELTSRSAIDEALQSLEEGRISGDEFAAKVASIFSDAREKIVAATETTAALSKGAILAWETLGNVHEVYWQTEGDDLVDDDCIENEEAGIVPLGTSFPSGHTEPPAHPNCRCTLIPVYS